MHGEDMSIEKYFFIGLSIASANSHANPYLAGPEGLWLFFIGLFLVSFIIFLIPLWMVYLAIKKSKAPNFTNNKVILLLLPAALLGVSSLISIILPPYELIKIVGSIFYAALYFGLVIYAYREATSNIAKYTEHRRAAAPISL